MLQKLMQAMVPVEKMIELYIEFEKTWNAFRFTVTAKKQGHEEKVFLMGEAVGCEGLTHKKFNIDEQLKKLVEISGEILICSTCLKSPFRHYRSLPHLNNG